MRDYMEHIQTFADELIAGFTTDVWRQSEHAAREAFESHGTIVGPIKRTVLRAGEYRHDQFGLPAVANPTLALVCYRALIERDEAA